MFFPLLIPRLDPRADMASSPIEFVGVESEFNSIRLHGLDLTPNVHFNGLNKSTTGVRFLNLIVYTGVRGKRMSNGLRHPVSIAECDIRLPFGASLLMFGAREVNLMPKRTYVGQ
jgi:hypothetical protein